MTDSLISGNSPPAPVTALRDPLTLAGPPVARTLLDVFAATVARCAGRTAIDAPGSTLTYLELDDAARGLANRLRSCGVGPGDRVGVRAPSGSAELYIAILGVLSAGAAYVPVDADDPDARAAAIFDDSGVCAVVGAQLQIAHLGEACGVDRQPLPDDDAWVIFTSGSTGRPKGVAVTHRAAAAFVDAEAGLWTVDPEDRVLAGLSVGFDASCEEIWLAWRNGATLVPAPRERVRAGRELGPWLAERRVTVVSTVPTLAAMWDEADLAAVRLLILGGEACPEPLAWRLAAGRELWNTYGPTEATVVSTATRIVPGSPVTIGWPLRGWEVSILDEVGEPVAVGEPGELVIGGVGLGRYLDPALDAERYAAVPTLGWPRAYRTGDIVCETIDGLRFIGRHDDQVKLGGRRIELGEVEAVLAGLPGVRAAAAALQKTEAGNPVLVGYVVGDVDPAAVSRGVSETLPQGVLPVVMAVDSLPLSGAGKVDRKALPWPPAADAMELTGTAAWLAERWTEQLGPLPIGIDSDFFELGGSSLAAAKLTSVLRERYPAVAVADIYEHRRLGELTRRLESIGQAPRQAALASTRARRGWGLAQFVGMLCVLSISSPRWVLGALIINRIAGARFGPQVGWGWLIAGWLLFATTPGGAVIALLARRLLLGGVRPGRYPRRGWLMWRLWFLERLAGTFRSESLGGTPFAARWARLCGHRVARGARLDTFPPAASLISVGEGATLESDIDLEGWWLEGDELVVGEIQIGAGARVGTRALLGPGASVGAGAEVEPGSVVLGAVPAGERWSGSPAVCVGQAGANWPKAAPPAPRARAFWKAMYVVGLGLHSLLALIAAAPLIGFLLLTGGLRTVHGAALRVLLVDPLIATCVILIYALVIALAVRFTSRLVRTGFQPDEGPTHWALWFSGSLMAVAKGVLFSLYSSVYIGRWLRLAGIRIGRRCEISTVVGINRHTSFADESFAADDVVLAGARARGGWLYVGSIEIGQGTFLGNGAIIQDDSRLGEGSLVGVQANAPRSVPAGTSWFGVPALELPRVRDRVDPSRTTTPPRRLVLARGATEVVRILLPTSISVVLATLMFWGLERLGKVAGIGAMMLGAPMLALAGGLCAAAITVAAKWTIIGRYRPSEHPLWSFFVWRDEIMNSLQEQLANPWLVETAHGTPLMSLYLRAMGAKVGRDVWFDTPNITEFDVVRIADGCVVNRHACVETHLFHDRLMRIGPTELGPGSTLGPSSVVLPDTKLGAGAQVGGRSVVMRGEELPAGSRWHGAPVVAR